MCASTALTSGMTSLPSTRIGRLERLRRAMWRTARFSVMLIFVAAEHAIAPFLDFRVSGQVEQKAQGFVGDAIFGEIQENVAEPQ